MESWNGSNGIKNGTNYWNNKGRIPSRHLYLLYSESKGLSGIIDSPFLYQSKLLGIRPDLQDKKQN